MTRSDGPPFRKARCAPSGNLDERFHTCTKLKLGKAKLSHASNAMQQSRPPDSLRLAGIAFDSKTLRVIVETEGVINAAVSALPAL